MDPVIVKCENWPIQEYAQCTSVIGGIRCSCDIQGEWGQISPTSVCYMFSEHRAQMYQYWNKEGSSSLDQAFPMCGMVDPYNLISPWVACVSTMKTNMSRAAKNATKY